MTCLLKEFFKAEDGAVTVDWVVLTASVVGLAILAWSSFFDATVTGLGSDTSDAIAQYESELDF